MHNYNKHSYTRMRNILVQQWYEPKIWGWLLWPFSQIFSALVRLRHFLYKKNILNVYRASVPVIIIGNITVGGTGKTPLVIYLARLLQQQGFMPGIITRGYKGKIRTAALVHRNADPYLFGDEAVLLANSCSCPVMIAKNRSVGVQALVQHHKVNIIISDDGLQHYALGRDIEVAVVDGVRGFGNGHSLPMGPLREMPSRLNSVDLTVVNGTDMQVVCESATMLQDPSTSVTLDAFSGKTVHAVAGIGNPQQYFAQLRRLGVILIEHAFPDHYTYSVQDVTFADALPILMTEKDAVKCRAFAKPQHWVVGAQVIVSETFVKKFADLVKGVVNGRSKTVRDSGLSDL